MSSLVAQLAAHPLPSAVRQGAEAAGLGPAWSELPGLTLVFCAIFVAAIPCWLALGLPWHKATLLASCAMSSVHGILSALGSWEELKGWGPKLELDAPNSPHQALLNQWSLAYMIADFVCYLIPNKDALFTAHHVLAGTYFVGALATGRGAIGSLLCLFLGEVTSPVFNSFTISRELRKAPIKRLARAADAVFALASPAFTVSFVLVRTVLSPPLVAWFVYTLWFRSPGLPAAWRWPMGACVVLGIIASQLWSVKLLKGYFRRRHMARRSTQLAAERQQHDKSA